MEVALAPGQDYRQVAALVIVLDYKLEVGLDYMLAVHPFLLVDHPYHLEVHLVVHLQEAGPWH